jgi:dihydroxyacetone kinase-like protein
MAKDNLNKEEARAMLLAVADAIIAAEPILTDADRALGDGDHGIGMTRGLTATKEALKGVEFESVANVFSTAGMAMISSMGGASGAIFGTLFRAGGKALKESETFGSQELANLLTSANEAIMKRGGAKPGDKTMIDALYPATEKAAELKGSSLVEALEAAAAAAEAGREASKDMIATMGGAKTLGERSLGKADAGAVSVTIILATMRDFVAS